jgi:hypothetical protein
VKSHGELSRGYRSDELRARHEPDVAASGGVAVYRLNPAAQKAHDEAVAFGRQVLAVENARPPAAQTHVQAGWYSRRGKGAPVQKGVQPSEAPALSKPDARVRKGARPARTPLFAPKPDAPNRVAPFPPGLNVGDNPR